MSDRPPNSVDQIPNSPKERSKRFIPSRQTWIVALAPLVVIPIAQLVEVIDSGMVNIITWGMIGWTLGVLFFWFAVRSAFSTRVRGLVVSLVLVVFVVLAARYEVTGTSGALVPTFDVRGAPRPDELLEPAETKIAETGIDLTSSSPHDFPQFLGPSRRNEVWNVKLDVNWNENPPVPVWKQPIGAGWSGFSAVNGFAVTMEQRRHLEMVTCYEIESGELKWSHSIEARHETIPGGAGPRCTPTIDQGRVYALGATGVLRCLDGATGELLWQHDLLKMIGVSAAQDLRSIAWGRAASPLIVDHLLIVPLGGAGDGEKSSLIAFDKQSGSEVWRGGDHQASYSSPAVANLLGVRQILSVNEDWVSSHNVETGETLWEHAWDGKSNANASSSQAVPIGDDLVFLSKGYAHGAELIRLSSSDDGTWHLESVWRRRVMKTKMSNVAVRDGYVFGLDYEILSCIEVGTGKRLWKKGRYGFGQVLLVGDVLLVVSEWGEVLAIEASPDRNRTVLGSFQAISGKTWNNLCLYGDYLLVRNAEEAACFKLSVLSSKGA